MSNYGLFVTALTFLSKASLSAKAFLSYSLSLSRKPISVNTFFAPSQSLFYPSRMHTASSTIRTASGGLAYVFIMLISSFLIALRASAAA